MDFLRETFQKPIVKRLLILVVIGVILYFMRSMLNLFLLTFILTYLAYNVQKIIHDTIKKVIHVKIKMVIVTISLYLITLILLGFCFYKYIPMAINEISYIINEMLTVIENNRNIVFNNEILDAIVSQLRTIDIYSYIKGSSVYLFKIAGNIFGLGINVLISIVLSLFFILEKDRITRFVSGFKESKMAGIFCELQFFGTKLLNSFGKVFQAQILIALCNSVISVIGLWILGFNQLIGLGVMIFLLSLIPVAGVIISFIPLSIIAFRIGGIMHILYLVILILIIHALENYFLNPKLMSVKTNLPVFFTLLLLIISEHLMGIWGLIIGIPIFIFLLDLIEFKNVDKRDCS